MIDRCVFVTAAFVFFVSVPVWSQVFEGEDESQSNKFQVGFVFSTDDILLEPEEFRGGIGLLLRNSPWLYRVSADAFVSSESNATFISVSLSGIHSIKDETVAPYLGLIAEVSRSKQESQSESDNFEESIATTVTTGPILGVELWVTTSVALFVEYGALLDIRWSKQTVSEDGNITTTDDREYLFNLGLANGGMLGVCVYF